MGKVLLDGGRGREAARSLEEAVRLRPDYGPARYHLAAAYRKLGRVADAERELRVFSELKDKERQPVPALLYHRGTTEPRP